MKNILPARNSLKQSINAKKIKKPSSQQWLKRQLNDIYVKAAKQEGYYSRAAFKLLEIQNKFHILKPNGVVIDLGAAPGGWSQVASKYIFKNGAKDGVLISVDLLDINPINGHIIKGDFTSLEVLQQIKDILGSKKVNVILSDMSPNTSGSKSLDHLRIMNLVDIAFDFSYEMLDTNGVFIAKVFQGGIQQTLLTKLKQNFKKVSHFKPNSSRKESNEIYVVALGYNPN